MGLLGFFSSLVFFCLTNKQIHILKGHKHVQISLCLGFQGVFLCDIEHLLQFIHHLLLLSLF